jgi:hypothetical protein
MSSWQRDTRSTEVQLENSVHATTDESTYVKYAPCDAFLSALAEITIAPCRSAKEPPIVHDRLDPCLDLVVGLASLGELCFLDHQVFVYGFDSFEFSTLS